MTRDKNYCNVLDASRKHLDVRSTNRVTADHSSSVSTSVAVPAAVVVEVLDVEVTEDVGMSIATFLIQSLYIIPGLVALLHAVYCCSAQF